jgi:hypothetical protein
VPPLKVPDPERLPGLEDLSQYEAVRLLYARERLEESGEVEEIWRAHAEYFLALAEEAEPEIEGPDQVAWMDRLEAEHDNLRAALSWSLETGDAENLCCGSEAPCGCSGSFGATLAKAGAG